MHLCINCLNFWDEVWWFLSLRVFRCPQAFFRCLSNLGTFMELRTMSFIESMGVACSEKWPFLDVLVTCTEQGFRSSVYHKPTFIGQYLKFNSHHPYTVKKGIFHCLQHRAKTISSNTDAYQEEMISLIHNLHCNNYSVCITSAPRNLDRRIEDNT